MGETPGVYIHIPFCASRCDYCDFYTVTRRGDLFEPYTEAVCRAVATAPLEAGREVGSVYFGGGTPALLGPKRLGKMLAAVAKRWVLAPDAEITLEANPGAVTGAALRGFREAGFNRLSLGVQSGADGRLRDLGRIHTAGGAAETVRLAREAGFENLTLDLMLGLPGQGVEEGLFSAEFILGLAPEHISCYLLQLEEGTRYAARYREEELDEESQRAVYLTVCDRLEAAGYRQYEISNFAKPGYESRHNLRYWTGAEYLGIGPSAAGYLGGERYSFPRDLEGFVTAADPWSLPVDEGPGGGEEETVMLRLRLADGVDTACCPGIPGLLDRGRRLAEQGLAVVEGSRVRLTREGFLVSNGAIEYLLWEV